jgi:hypothetical protein
MKYRIRNAQVPPEFALDRAPAEVKKVVAVLEKFMPITRIRLGRSRSDIVGAVRFDDRRVFLLFASGRWTSTSGEDAFTLGYEWGYSNGRRTHYGDTERALGPLATLGLISETEAKETRTWIRQRWEVTEKKDRIERLQSDAREFGHKLVPLK